jgi:hypothetical protein
MSLFVEAQEDFAKNSRQYGLALLEQANRINTFAVADAVAGEMHGVWLDGFRSGCVTAGTDPLQLRMRATATKKMVNINLPWDELDAGWKVTNLKMATFVCDLFQIARNDPNWPDNKEHAVSAIHEKWLEMNPWAESDPILSLPYAQLPPAEQKKDQDWLTAVEKRF